MRTLIVADPWDIHVRAVAWALEKMGEQVSVWYTHDFPQKSAVSISLENSNNGHTNGIEFYCARDYRPTMVLDADAVWLRRWYQPAASPKLHPADVKFAQTESGEFIRATMQLLDEKPRFWINPIAAKLRSDRKPVQLANAMEVGLRIPRTLLSNDPERIRNFYRENDKRIVYKPLTAASWVSDDKAFATYTTRVTDELLRNDASLSNAPGIYQECIEKEFELRITVIGRSIFAAKLESQKDGFYLTDWRANQLDHKMPCAVFQLPLEIEEKCFALMDRLGIVFGCIDMVATPEGGYVFLEVNEMGQFLWIEDANPDFPLLDCFVNFLAARNPKYRYQAGNPQCSFGNFLDWMKSQPDFEPDGTRHIPLPRSYEMQE